MLAREALEARLADFVGCEIGPPEPGPDPVNAPMIRHFCEAVGDENPAYLDPDWAARSRHGGLVAPPAMLQAWVLRGLRPAPRDRLVELLALLREAGYPDVVATDCEQTYDRAIRPGDRLTLRTTIESVSPEKGTGLGPGRFVDLRLRFEDAQGAQVGAQRFRLLLFRGAGAGAGAALEKPRRPRPPASEDTRFFAEGLERGELRIQRCAACGRLRHPPRPMCPACQSLERDFVVAAGRGTLHSFTVLHHPAFPPFEYPLVVALVDLEEGTRLVADLVDVEPGSVAIGMAVEAEVREVEEGLALPVFVPAGRRAARAPAPAAPSAVGAPARRAATLCADEVAVGDALAPLEVPITVTGIVAGALASRDYQDVHHDADAARRQGLPNVFMNILTTNGYIGRYATDWAGPEAVLRGIAIRLGAPNLPGDTMTLTGTVAAREADEVSLAVEGRNGLGSHVRGTVRLALPPRGAR
jgi:uncharacterized OB-fold protein/acyl dehydratase